MSISLNDDTFPLGALDACSCYDKPTIPAGRVPCNDCEVGKRGVRIKNESGEGYHTDWCPTCNGYGHVRGIK